MALGLPVSSLINVNVNLQPLAAQTNNFNSLMIVGDSNVIDVGQRYRSYASISAVANDFGTSAPEYAAALLFFSQQPQPNQLYIGRWAQAATAGLLKGAILTSTQQALANFTAVTNGGVNFTINGTAKNLTGLNFSGATNLNGVASIITTALGSSGSCAWTGSQFIVTSATTGASSTLGYAAAGAGTDVSGLLGLTQAAGATVVNGVVAESALAAVQALDSLAINWYGVMFATPDIVDADRLAVAAYIQATQHIFGVSTSNTAVLNAATTTDIASLLMSGGYTRTVVQYSQIPYAIASLFGRAFTTDFTQSNSVITLAYKQEPDVNPEGLTSTQQAALIAKRCNYFASYSNGTAILMNGVMSGPAYFDEIQGTDALANAIQTNVYNLLYGTATKVPQTDEGEAQIVNVIEATLVSYVANGLLAPGTWTTTGFGTLNYGDLLPKGYYVYAPATALQAASARAARFSVPIQIAVKLAGAIQSANITINVNR